MSQADYKSCSVGRVSNYASLLILSAFSSLLPLRNSLNVSVYLLKYSRDSRGRAIRLQIPGEYLLMAGSKLSADTWSRGRSARSPRRGRTPPPPTPSRPVPTRTVPLRRRAQLTYFFLRFSPHRPDPSHAWGSKAFTRWQRSRGSSSSGPAPVPRLGAPAQGGRGARGEKAAAERSGALARRSGP